MTTADRACLLKEPRRYLEVHYKPFDSSLIEESVCMNASFRAVDKRADDEGTVLRLRTSTVAVYMKSLTQVIQNSTRMCQIIC